MTENKNKDIKYPKEEILWQIDSSKIINRIGEIMVKNKEP